MNKIKVLLLLLIAILLISACSKGKKAHLLSDDFREEIMFHDKAIDKAYDEFKNYSLLEKSEHNDLLLAINNFRVIFEDFDNHSFTIHTNDDEYVYKSLSSYYKDTMKNLEITEFQINKIPVSIETIKKLHEKNKKTLRTRQDILNDYDLKN